MSIRVTCPECNAQYPIAAGLLDDDGKRLAALTGEMEPLLARAALSYLKFFKPAKTALRTSRALAILLELHELVSVGSICKDERSGLRRPATFKMWVTGIEQMHQVDGRLSLPLSNHNYLRSIVFGIADTADAKHERVVNQPGASQPLAAMPARDEHAVWLDDQLRRGFITQEEHAQQTAKRQELLNASAALKSVPTKERAR